MTAGKSESESGLAAEGQTAAAAARDGGWGKGRGSSLAEGRISRPQFK